MLHRDSLRHTTSVFSQTAWSQRNFSAGGLRKFVVQSNNTRHIFCQPPKFTDWPERNHVTSSFETSYLHNFIHLFGKISLSWSNKQLLFTSKDTIYVSDKSNIWNWILLGFLFLLNASSWFRFPTCTLKTVRTDANVWFQTWRRWRCREESGSATWSQEEEGPQEDQKDLQGEEEARHTVQSTRSPWNLRLVTQSAQSCDQDGRH